MRASESLSEAIAELNPRLVLADVMAVWSQIQLNPHGFGTGSGLPRADLHTVEAEFGVLSRHKYSYLGLNRTLKPVRPTR
jgi:hypothetical protein